MPQTFNLIKNTDRNMKRRVFPRFPIITMAFKTTEKLIFEVVDISQTGMQIRISDTFKISKLEKNNVLAGEIHWKGDILKCVGKIQWVSSERLGISFDLSNGFDLRFDAFINESKIIQEMKPLHLSTFMMDSIPHNLACWLQSEGPFEIFVWVYNDREIEKFQIVYFKNFLEYKVGKGLIQGKIVSDRNIEMPLNKGIELTVKIEDVEDVLDQKDYIFLEKIINVIPENYIDSHFLKLIKSVLF